MDFALSPEQRLISEQTRRLIADFDDGYWLARDADGRFPEDFYRAVADGGWLGIALPQAYGGSGLGALEAALLMHAIADSPGAMSAASAIHINIFGPQAIAVFASPEQRQRWLPALIRGEQTMCFGVTEPDAGLDTANVSTRAEADGRGAYRIYGRKLWTSTARRAAKILLLARTTARERCRRPLDGLSLFYTDLDRTRVEIREIAKMGRHAVDSNELLFDGLAVPADDMIGAEGEGFRYLLHSLNPERILIAAEAVGIGRQALQRAAGYARERQVFGRAIGQNQGIQHPLAESWMELEAAWLATLHAAWRYDAGLACGPAANSAKYLSAEAGYRACERALLTHGGMGYAKEYHIERLLREVMITRIAPVSPQLILCYIAERVLGLPKSY